MMPILAATKRRSRPLGVRRELLQSLARSHTAQTSVGGNLLVDNQPEVSFEQHNRERIRTLS